MDIPPDQRLRLAGTAPTPWQNSPEGSRQLPSISTNAQPQLQQYQHHPGLNQTSFSRLPLTPPVESYYIDPHRSSERSSEHSLYGHQDPRRLGSGPSHGYQNGPPAHPLPPPAPPGQQPPIPPYAGQRDPIVKRDPSNEPQQPYRPPSTGAEHNVNPSPHHEGPGRPYHPAYDPARNQQYPPQPPLSNPYPPVQSPMSATEPYGNNPYGGLPAPRDYQTVTYPS
ncbi:hypothetical protein IFR05_015916, partial [Cadophora sp. M221]